jgi:hypothetical protein
MSQSTPLDDRCLTGQPHARNVPSWSRSYVQYWHTRTIRPVSSISIILCPSQRTHASCVRTHVPDPYTTVSFSTDPYAPVKPRGSALIPLMLHPVFRPKLNAFLYMSGSSFTHKATDSGINSITSIYYIVSYYKYLLQV